MVTWATRGEVAAIDDMENDVMKIEIEVTNEVFEFLKMNLVGSPLFIQRSPIAPHVQYDGGECTAPQVVASEGDDSYSSVGELASFYIEEYVTMLQDLVEDGAVGAWDCFGTFIEDDDCEEE